MPEETEKNVQKVSQAIFDALRNHEHNYKNPHNVTASQTGSYTKQETNEAINEKIQQIGAGDMAKGVYDTHNNNTDIFDYADSTRFQFPIGYIFDWLPVEGQQPDLSTPEKVAEYFGYGTWQEISGRFTFGRKEGYEVGSTGGEETHVITKSELPNYQMPVGGSYRKGTPLGQTYNGIQLSESTNDGNIPSCNVSLGGSSKAHNNMPPYLTVYKWQRTA